MSNINEKIEAVRSAIAALAVEVAVQAAIAGRKNGASVAAKIEKDELAKLIRTGMEYGFKVDAMRILDAGVAKERVVSMNSEAENAYAVAWSRAVATAVMGAGK